MWPRGSNCSFLIGISDYFEDIKRHQSSSLDDTDKVEIDAICKSLNNIITNQKSGAKSNQIMRTDEGEGDEEGFSLDEKIRKFYEWGETYINITGSDKSVNWEQLVELFNFQKPHYEIPSSVDVTLYHGTFLYKTCKEKGNEYMRNKQPERALQMYSKAIELLEKADVDETEKNEEKQSLEEEEEKKHKPHKNEIAIIYCNRSASWVYLKQYQKAVDDAVTALELDPLLTKAWIRKGMAEHELKRYQVAYGDYQVALNQAKESDTYYKFLNKRIKQCFDQIIMQHTNAPSINSPNAPFASNTNAQFTNVKTPVSNSNAPFTPQ